MSEDLAKSQRHKGDVHPATSLSSPDALKALGTGLVQLGAIDNGCPFFSPGADCGSRDRMEWEMVLPAPKTAELSASEQPQRRA